MLHIALIEPFKAPNVYQAIQVQGRQQRIFLPRIWPEHIYCKNFVLVVEYGNWMVLILALIGQHRMLHIPNFDGLII